jgi:hypothetical protein
MPDYISPHITAWGRYGLEQCREDETRRQLFGARHSSAERYRVHFGRGNWDLFDKESAL